MYINCVNTKLIEKAKIKLIDHLKKFIVKVIFFFIGDGRGGGRRRKQQSRFLKFWIPGTQTLPKKLAPFFTKVDSSFRNKTFDTSNRKYASFAFFKEKIAS